MRFGFTVSGGISLLLAAPLLAASNPSMQGREIVAETLLHLPPSVGKVSDLAWSPGAMPDLILIQDAHDCPEVQAHISQTILLAYQHWGVRRVFMEGAMSPVDLSMFHRVPVAIRLRLLGALLMQGELKGPELATEMIMEHEWSNPPPKPFQLTGLEDPRLYEENLRLFGEIRRSQRSAQQALQAYSQSSLMNRRNPLQAKQLHRINDLLKLRLSPEEYVDYWNYRQQVSPPAFLERHIRLAEQFYRVAEQRSFVFLDEVYRRLPAAEGPRILVVGGFHTAMMAEVLRSRHLSFIVVTPHSAGPNDSSLYEKNMAESLKTLHLPGPNQRLAP